MSRNSLVKQAQQFTMKQQARLIERLRKLGAPIPKKEVWEDEVMYNNSLLEAVELAEEMKK